MVNNKDKIKEAKKEYYEKNKEETESWILEVKEIKTKIENGEISDDKMSKLAVFFCEKYLDFLVQFKLLESKLEKKGKVYNE